MNEEALYQAAEAYAKALCQSLPEPESCSHTFSPKFEKKMKGVLHQARHPAVKRTLQTAACLFLTLAALFGFTLAVNVEAREAVFGWIQEKCDAFFTHYRYTGIPSEDEGVHYRPGWLPEGFSLLDSATQPGGEILVYASDTGEILDFTYSHAPESMDFYLGTENCSVISLTVGDCPATMYIPEESNRTTTLVWMNEAQDTLFILSSMRSQEEILRIAENIKIF